jgi:hypothetical protein
MDFENGFGPVCTFFIKNISVSNQPRYFSSSHHCSHCVNHLSPSTCHPFDNSFRPYNCDCVKFFVPKYIIFNHFINSKIFNQRKQKNNLMFILMKLKVYLYIMHHKWSVLVPECVCLWEFKCNKWIFWENWIKLNKNVKVIKSEHESNFLGFCHYTEGTGGNQCKAADCG